jgi:uncharacterized protein YdcH (DUF465 family)
MPLEHHPLIKEFPQHRELIHRLKQESEEFRFLFAEYHRVDRELFRIGREIDATSDARALQLKRRRLFLEDRLLELVRQASLASQPPVRRPGPSL